MDGVNATDLRSRVAALACWSGRVEPQPLSGGISNASFLVEDRGERFVVRLGGDIPVHHVSRANELAASRAAHAVGLSPEIVHHEPGVLVLRFIAGRTLAAEDLRARPMLQRVVPMLRKCHREMPSAVRGPGALFWVFHVLRDYAATLREAGSRTVPDLPRYLQIAARLEAAVGPIELVFGHNDLLPANFIDDGSRLWLIDWEYAGYDSPLFDLANLASNCGLSAADETWLLEAYFQRPADAALRRSYGAMKCASLLRESMWSMVSELHLSQIDYVAYTAEYLARFERAWTALEL